MISTKVERDADCEEYVPGFMHTNMAVLNTEAMDFFDQRIVKGEASSTQLQILPADSKKGVNPNIGISEVTPLDSMPGTSALSSREKEFPASLPLNTVPHIPQEFNTPICQQTLAAYQLDPNSAYYLSQAPYQSNDVMYSMASSSQMSRHLAAPSNVAFPYCIPYNNQSVAISHSLPGIQTPNNFGYSWNSAQQYLSSTIPYGQPLTNLDLRHAQKRKYTPRQPKKRFASDRDVEKAIMSVKEPSVQRARRGANPESTSRRLNMCYRKGTLLLSLEGDLRKGDAVWVVHNYQLVQKYELERTDQLGRIYARTARYRPWMSNEPWAYFPLEHFLVQPFNMDDEYIILKELPNKEQIENFVSSHSSSSSSD